MSEYAETAEIGNRRQKVKPKLSQSLAQPKPPQKKETVLVKVKKAVIEKKDKKTWAKVLFVVIAAPIVLGTALTVRSCDPGYRKKFNNEISLDIFIIFSLK